MLIEVKVPQLSESVSEATLVSWHKKEGDAVSRDENLIDIETDKVVLETPAPADGVLVKIVKNGGDSVTSGEVIATIDTEAKAAAGAPAAAPSGAGKEVKSAKLSSSWAGDPAKKKGIPTRGDTSGGVGRGNWRSGPRGRRGDRRGGDGWHRRQLLRRRHAPQHGDGLGAGHHQRRQSHAGAPGRGREPGRAGRLRGVSVERV